MTATDPQNSDETMHGSDVRPAGALNLEESGTTSGTRSGLRPAIWPDPLYGSVRVAGWAAALLATPPFARLGGISLSDVPGEVLFGQPFPSRLDHTRGVYHLARLARPRDRTLQAAALAHDLGHGPFSHLSEPLMREWLGCDHEERAARQLLAVRAALSPTVMRRLAWLDWDEVASLVLGAGPDGRGALLSGRLDYDNADNVARFLSSAGMGEPGYIPEALARGLRVLTAEAAADASEQDTVPARATREPVYLLAPAEADARAWQAARARLYGYLHGDHRNLAPHAMLRKSIDLALAERSLSGAFLDMTDAEALASLAGHRRKATALLAQHVLAGLQQWHSCLWEAEVPTAAVAARNALAEWRTRLVLEEELAGEAGLAPHDVILEALVSRAGRALPPVATAGRPLVLTWLPSPLPAPRLLHLFVAAGTPRDYCRRLRAAAERRLGALGVVGVTERQPEHPQG